MSVAFEGGCLCLGSLLPLAPGSPVRWSVPVGAAAWMAAPRPACSPLSGLEKALSLHSEALLSFILFLPDIGFLVDFLSPFWICFIDSWYLLFLMRNPCVSAGLSPMALLVVGLAPAGGWGRT